MAEQMEVVPFPHCPHCDAELPAPSLFSWQHMGWVILCVFCPNPDCLKTIHLQIAPAVAAAAAEAAGSPLIRN
jgi:hypothetical protein